MGCAESRTLAWHVQVLLEACRQGDPVRALALSDRLAVEALEIRGRLRRPSAGLGGQQAYSSTSHPRPAR